MITVINYANDPYKKTQKYCTESAYEKGQVDKVIEYGPDDIDTVFYSRNKSILEKSRGGGYGYGSPILFARL